CVVGPGVDGEMAARGEIAYDLVGGAGQTAVAGLAAGEYQRNASLVDENGVGLVDYGGMKGAVDLLPRLHGDTVAEVIEADLVLGGVGDIGGVGGAPLGGGHSLLYICD